MSNDALELGFFVLLLLKVFFLLSLCLLKISDTLLVGSLALIFCVLIDVLCAAELYLQALEKI